MVDKIAELKTLAAGTDADAAKNASSILGEMYLSGWGISKDQTQANQYLQQAANAGDSQAAAILGKSYYDGENGFSQDYTQAFTWFDKSAEAGSTISAYYLGYMYLNGQGTTQDLVKSQQCFESCAAILPSAKRILDLLFA